MLKIAVLGSCVSRDPFNSKFIPDYSKYAKCVFHQNQMSMVSLVSPPITFDESDIFGLSPFDANHFKTELSKIFFDKMFECQPDYLILDFYGDLYYGIQKVGEDSWITNKKWLFSKTRQYHNLDLRETMSLFSKNDKEVYLELWRNGIKCLFDFLKRELPSCKVIVNKARFVDIYLDATTGRFCKVGDKHRYINVDVYNKWWDALDNYVIKNYNTYTLNYESKTYYSVEDHPWGMFYVHYNNEFYQDFTRQLLIIALNDSQYKNEIFIQKSSMGLVYSKLGW